MLALCRGSVGALLWFSQSPEYDQSKLTPAEGLAVGFPLFSEKCLGLRQYRMVAGCIGRDLYVYGGVRLGTLNLRKLLVSMR